MKIDSIFLLKTFLVDKSKWKTAKLSTSFSHTIPVLHECSFFVFLTKVDFYPQIHRAYDYYFYKIHKKLIITIVIKCTFEVCTFLKVSFLVSDNTR